MKKLLMLLAILILIVPVGQSFAEATSDPLNESLNKMLTGLDKIAELDDYAGKTVDTARAANQLLLYTTFPTGTVINSEEQFELFIEIASAENIGTEIITTANSTYNAHQLTLKRYKDIRDISQKTGNLQFVVEHHVTNDGFFNIKKAKMKTIARQIKSTTAQPEKPVTKFTKHNIGNGYIFEGPSDTVFTNMDALILDVTSSYAKVKIRWFDFRTGTYTEKVGDEAKSSLVKNSSFLVGNPVPGVKFQVFKVNNGNTLEQLIFTDIRYQGENAARVLVKPAAAKPVVSNKTAAEPKAVRSTAANGVWHINMGNNVVHKLDLGNVSANNSYKGTYNWLKDTFDAAGSIKPSSGKVYVKLSYKTLAHVRRDLEHLDIPKANKDAMAKEIFNNLDVYKNFYRELSFELVPSGKLNYSTRNAEIKGWSINYDKKTYKLRTISKGKDVKKVTLTKGK